MTRCKACASGDLYSFYRVQNVPTNDVYVMDSREEAVTYPRGEIDLAVCRRCTFIQNLRFDPGLVQYSPRCEESQAASDRFNEFVEALVSRLVDHHHLVDQTIVEIGCGKGDFLAALCSGRGVRRIGVDPAYRDYRDQGNALPDIRFVQDVIENHPELVAAADVVVCRHTLEHIADPVDFMRFIRRHMNDTALLFFEVPDAKSVLNRFAFWDIYYEHCGYFCEQSLRQILARAGFRIDELYTGFDDQYLIAEARPAIDTSNDAIDPYHDDIVSLCEQFRDTIIESLEKWRNFLDDAHRAGRRVVVWGGGSKAVALLTTLEIKLEVDYVVDINPHKQNKYLPGTGHPILAPKTLIAQPADVVVLMNPIYADEVRGELDTLGVHPELYCIT